MTASRTFRPRRCSVFKPFYSPPHGSRIWCVAKPSTTFEISAESCGRWMTSVYLRGRGRQLRDEMIAVQPACDRARVLLQTESHVVSEAPLNEFQRRHRPLQHLTTLLTQCQKGDARSSRFR